MITLCPTTFEQASKMKNFSAWVRKKLLEDLVDQSEQQQEQTRHRCPACWKVFVNKYEFDVMHCMNKDCGYTKPLEALE